MDSFPSALINISENALPIEVFVLGYLGLGSGDRFIDTAKQQQSHHANYQQDYDEPSALLAGIHPLLQDYTAIHTFVVESQGHPFHRHAGHRVFTAVSGSGGTELRFVSPLPSQLPIVDHEHFLNHLHTVIVPADSLFTVRFGPNVWHQFVPHKSGHPALFAVSCHTNELGGDLNYQTRQLVASGAANIADLTELLPSHIADPTQSKIKKKTYSTIDLRTANHA